MGLLSGESGAELVRLIRAGRIHAVSPVSIASQSEQGTYLQLKRAPQSAPPLKDLEPLLVVYDWEGTGMYDLDTATTFLGTTVGWNIGDSSDYLDWDTGDNTGINGHERVVVYALNALRDRKWSGSVEVQLGADWYTPAGGSGSARVTVSFNGVSLSKTISPDQEDHGAHTQVGTINVSQHGALGLVFSLS